MRYQEDAYAAHDEQRPAQQHVPGRKQGWLGCAIAIIHITRPEIGAERACFQGSGGCYVS